LRTDERKPNEPAPPAPLTPQVGAALRLVAGQLAFFTALRVAFYLAFRDTAGEVDGGELARAFRLGFLFDLRLAILVALPLLVLGALPLLRPTRKPGAILWRAWLVVAGLVITLVHGFDFGHYDWLHERLDAKVLDELRSPKESFGMMWESYPMVRALLGVAVVAVGWYALAAWAARRANGGGPATRRARVLVRTGATIAVVLGIYGSLSWYPLRWSQAFFGTSPFVSAVASNPVLYFYETLTHRGQKPDPKKVAAEYDRIADLLGVDESERDRDALAFRRSVEPAARPDFAPNLIVIHMESWAAFQMGMFGCPLPSSPHADALAAESVLFTNGFVPSGPTARSVFSMLTGVPDIATNNPKSSASRDPGSVRQPVLINALSSYDKHYFLGGSANWANIRALLAGNIPDVEIHEEGSYGGDRVDVWGVSDHTLFEHAVETFDSVDGPFFGFIQTSGNHSPYTIPERILASGEFELTDLDDETLRAAGFKSPEAYDGFRCLDHALGRFLELARQRPWYRDTVIVLYGDHGVPSVNDAPFERIGIVRHHVPLIVHAPRLLPEARRIGTPTSSMDLVPTALTLMGVPYVNSSMGRDALAERPEPQRFAFLSNGLVGEDWFWRIERDGRTGLYRYLSDEPHVDWSDREPRRREDMRTAHEALRQWALWRQHEGSDLLQAGVKAAVVR